MSVQFMHAVKYNTARLVLTATLVGLTVPAMANDPAANLNRLLTNVKSMTANFSQTTKGGASQQNFSGTMAVTRPNKFRWQTTSPSEQLIVANGSTLWVYDKDLRQATKQSTSSQVGETPALLLSGNPAQISRNFSVSQPDASKNYYLLTPKSGASFRNLSISFNGGKPVMMVLNDNLGQTTTIRFSNVKTNGSIAASQFSFTPPAGTDIIEQ